MLLYTNVRSIVGKLGELSYVAQRDKPDVIILTETWLHDDIMDAEVALAGYALFRCNRRIQRGGGVLFYVADGYGCQVIEHYNTPDGLSELLICKLLLANGVTTTLAGFYRSPQNRDTRWIGYIQQVTKAPRFVIFGDFNAPNINWNAPSDGQSISNVKTLLIATMEESKAIQHVNVPTRLQPNQRESILDLLFTESTENPSFLKVREPLSSSDHSQIWAEFRLGGKLRKANNTIPNIWQADFNALRDAGAAMDWSLPVNDLHGTGQKIRQNIERLYDEHVPRKKAAAALRGAPWIDRELRRELQARKRAWRVYRTSRKPEDYERYKRLRNLCKTHGDLKRKQFEFKLIEGSKEQPHRVFSYINRRLRKSDELPTLTGADGEVVTGDRERAELLAETYEAVYTRTTTDSSSSWELGRPLQDAPACEPDVVFNLLRRLNTKKAPGIDGIHPLFLFHLASVLAPPLAELFTQSIRTGTIPIDWKEAVIKPFYKGGDKHAAGNYRPVSLTSTVGKIMERWVKELLMAHAKEERVLTEQQHGFVPPSRGPSVVLSPISP